MSTFRISGHIPDLDLITFYSEKCNSFASRMSPWTKAILLLLIIVFITAVNGILLLTCLYAVILMIYHLSGSPVKKLFEWYTLPLLFVLSLVLLLAWGEPGNIIFSVPLPGFPLALTDNGIMLVVRLVLKALISVTFSLFFLMTTKYNHFSAMIYRVFPSPIDQIFLMSYRFIFITLKMVDSMVKSIRSRGGGLIKGIKNQGKMFAEVFALVFIRSYDRAERINKAMVSRGFNGKYMAVSEIPKMRPAEYILVLISLIFTIYAALFLKLPI